MRESELIVFLTGKTKNEVFNKFLCQNGNSQSTITKPVAAGHGLDYS